MATETDNKTVSTDGGASAGSSSPSAAKVGDGGKITRPRKLSFPIRQVRNKKKIALYSLLTAAVVIGGWIFLKQVFHIGEKVYAQADGHKIYKRDVKGLIGKAKGVSDHDAATVLADKYLTKALAKEQNITVSDADIQAEYGDKVDLKQQKKDNAYLYQLTVNNTYFDKLQAKYQGVYKGYLIVAQFSRYISTSPIAPAYKAAIPEMGDPKAIAADKKYAKDFITKLSNQLNDHKITWQQAAKMEYNDPRLGRVAYPALSHSGPFNTSKEPQTLFDAPSAQREIGKLSAGQISKPFAVSVYSPETKKSFDSYYLLVRMDSTYGGGHAGGTFLQFLIQSRQQLGYKVNV